jgi:flavorubredoxin
MFNRGSIMENIYKDLYQHTTFVEPINLSFHQYLLLTEKPLLVHTGEHNNGPLLIKSLKEVLKGRELSYIFISHFESDEAGALQLLLNEYKEATVLCSEVTSRQLAGFGMGNENVKVVDEKSSIVEKDFTFEFISYPAEMHLWEGLFGYEKKRKIFFSSDTMIAFGKPSEKVVTKSFDELIGSLTIEQIPDAKKLIEIQNTLMQLEVDFVAPGHGPTYLTKEA